MSDSPKEFHPPSDSGLWLNVAGYLMLTLLFVVIAAIAYLPNRPPALDTERDAFRRAERIKVESAAAEANRYGWIDRDGGVVRLPIERAMEVTVRDLAAASPSPAVP